MLLAGQALEAVRRQLQTREPSSKVHSVRSTPKLGRAMTLRETLQAIYASPDYSTAESQLQWWCGRALRSRLEAFRTLAKTVRQHWEGILAYFDSGLTSAAIEAINGIIQLAKRIARGFKNFLYFRTAAYLRAGCLRFELPVIN
jgi:transposase